MPTAPENPEEQFSSSTGSASSRQPFRICVFGSATLGTSEVHVAAARSLAQSLHRNEAQLVYGGGITGLMGELAKTFVSLSGPHSVHGVIPRGTLEFKRPGGASKSAPAKIIDAGIKGKTLRKRLGLASSVKEQSSTKSSASKAALLSESEYGRTTVVKDIQARKKLMCQLVSEGGPGSGFIALSGGFGTMDELMEVIALRQYAIHTTRICLLNIEGFWDPLLAWVASAIAKGFVRPTAADNLTARDTAEECIAWLRQG